MTQPAAQPISAQAWVATALGEPTEVLERQTVEVRAPGPNEVRVAVRAFCLNFNDIDIIKGRYTTLPLQPPFVPGMEAVGVVESAGLGAEHLVGRRVVGIPVMAFGGYASYAIVDAATVLDLPEWVSDVDGAALHYPFHLGWFALRERGRLQPGETLLVHAAAGGTGSGALVLGKALGARVIATAGSDEKVEFCRKLGADHAINYRTGDWVEQVMDLTYGRGVDVAFDAVGGTVTTDTFRCMGFNGRHLMAGFAEDIALEDGDYISPRPIAYGNFDVCGVCLVYVTDPLAVRRTLGFNWPARSEGLDAHVQILELMRTGQIRTVVGDNVTWDQLPQALQRMAARQTIGRLVVSTGAHD
ncbi:MULTISPECIES: NADPH:quinone oxidoreductase family protein [unclassified Mycolicibacterium]|uniref:NADPH:quinone oxidoreductase family protein n=1 Tax=unclassified Mycolicibacterium TaxID=2636767 RepID=UPI0012DCEA1C|nr:MULTISPECIES: NADPH:quinone oxidoreductase family protein [unclassified Mycolicibacterium]MUL80349.1 NADPH:quinone oxidoreductase family protein [Mycolicibacterium sp. CBMA 329]MUL86116.1 NADPH:quinone oxidoreductase family protein [Mycolicibacterium sp. CBMA 331]MUM00890.1 NADPH:quinone oxidoreductase family protein [Mycolicibacterium sp. CBMA 334]MUM26217.1 NADPH:quinone oxidoreductase family protein [Mycolicibacterium sp. CBMA 295]MUM36412.1 NADPH:quinone oxidoreductase family protein [M